MLQDQTLPIDFGGGIDTKSDPKVIAAGKFLLLENATLSTPKRATKRNGYDVIPSAILGGGNLVAPQMVKTYNGELICQDQGTLYGFSPTLQEWIPRGPYASVEITESVLSRESALGGQIDCAVYGNYALYVWSTNFDGSLTNALGPGSVPLKTYAMLVDVQNGSVIMPATLLASDTGSGLVGSSARAVLLGGTQLGVIFYSSQGSRLFLRLLNLSTLTFGSKIAVANPIFSNSNGWLTVAYDVVATATGCAVFYPILNTTMGVQLISTTGTLGASQTITDHYADGSACAISLDAGTGNLWCYWTGLVSGTYTMKCQIYSSTLTAGSTFTVVAQAQVINQVITIPVNATSQTVFFGTVDATSGKIYQTMQVQVASLVAGSPTLFALGVAPLSRAATVSGISYGVFLYQGVQNSATGEPNNPGFPQPTLFLLNLSTGAVIARFAAGIAGSNASQALCFCPSLPSLSATRLLYGFGEEFQFEALNSTYYDLAQNLVGASSAVFDFGSARAYRSIVSGDLCILNGANPSAYDGATCAEWGFHLAPEILSLTATSVASPPPNVGSIGPGTYSYVAVFGWTDGQGNLHRSATSLPVSVVTPGTYNKVTAVITAPYLTQKKNVFVELYRTKAGLTTYFLVTDPFNLTYPTAGSAYVTFADPFADSELDPRPILYTSGNVVDNSPPPPSMIMESRINRLWLVDSENPNTLWYTKSFSPGTGLSPSAFLTLQLDPKLGSIAGLSEMDDKMVVFKDQGIFLFAGDGGNDTGSGSTLTTPQILPSDGGCSSLKSIILTPNGVFYKSQKGIYLLNRSLQTSYIGGEVEAFNSQSVSASVIMASVNQVWFLTASGSTLVFDYSNGQWSIFTNHTGLSADIYQGKLTYARASGAIYQENTSGSYRDGATAFKVRAQTAWLALAGVQGFQRVRRVGLLGDFAGAAGHGVQVSAAYDFSTTFNAPVAYSFGGSSGVFQYRERLQQQKCDALSLLIEEVTTGAAGEYIDLTNLSLEVGVKRGLNKQSAGNSVG